MEVNTASLAWSLVVKRPRCTHSRLMVAISDSVTARSEPCELVGQHAEVVLSAMSLDLAFARIRAARQRGPRAPRMLRACCSPRESHVH